MSSGICTAVFDFDHTLTSCDTAGRFFGWLLRRNPVKVLIAVPAALVLSPLLASRRTRRIPVRFGVWLATFGHTHAQLQALAVAHVAELATRDGPQVRADGRAQIRAHQSQGHIVVIATGALEYLARAILAREGIDNIVVVGSSLRRYWGGMVAERHCFGEQKIPILQARGFAPPWAFVYSDHLADLPLLSAGERQFLVNPSARTVAYLLPRLGASATVVKWR